MNLDLVCDTSGENYDTAVETMAPGNQNQLVQRQISTSLAFIAKEMIEMLSKFTRRECNAFPADNTNQKQNSKYAFHSSVVI